MPVDRIAPGDRMMLLASRRWPQEIGALAILDGSRLLDTDGNMRLDEVCAFVAARLHLVPRFRQIVYTPPRGFGGPIWIDAPDFDVREHIGVLPLPAGSGEAELIAATERVAQKPIDMSRPLWEMCFMPGLQARRVGLFIRMHHAIADGTAAMTNIAVLLDTDPAATIREPLSRSPRPLPSRRELVLDAVQRRAAQVGRVLWACARPWISVRRVVAALPGTREMLAEEPGPKTSLDRLIGTDRNLALVRTGIDALKEIAHAHGTTVNDVLLALTAGGLRALLRSRGEFPDKLPVYVPVAVRRRLAGVQQGNRLAQMTVWLPLGVGDPVARLRAIAAATRRVKAKGRPELGTLFGLIPSRILLKLAAAQRVNVTTANIHGPELPLYLAGAQVLEVFPVLPLVGTVALGVGGVSYAGAFNIGVVGDRAAYPDIDVLAAGIRDELHALRVSIPHTSSRATADPEPIRDGLALAGRGSKP